MIHPVYIDGQWRPADATSTFRAFNPQTREALPDQYPVSSWADCEAALSAAYCAAEGLRGLPGDRIARFLESMADKIETRAEELVDMAHAETALPRAPRLADAELPRTTGQLRLAAAAARDGSWSSACIDTQAGIRSYLAPLGPVCVFGPNNFPFAFGSLSGGDFAAAIAAGNPVIGKANSSHPGTTRIFAEIAAEAEKETEMPTATVQLLYRTAHEDGERMVADPRVGATGYTGSRHAGLRLKAAADAAGNPIYLELSSVNPVVILPGALRERGDALVTEFAGSCLMGTGQFCTNPGLVLLLKGDLSDTFITSVAQQFAAAPSGTLLSAGVEKSLRSALDQLVSAGAKVVGGGADQATNNDGYSVANTVLRVTGSQFVANPMALQAEAFGNATLFVVADDVTQLRDAIDRLEGNLTGCIYSDTQGADDQDYDAIVDHLRTRVGRLLNDKMPTGVAVSAAMNHGGPYPATGHPGFTAVGIPASLHRFAMLQCFDNVRPHRLPTVLRDANPNGTMWRWIDGAWSQQDVTAS
ncbi:MAG: aldehyde dehydrogenase (NADP(+)) [Planctomycetales bacterium]|nr:aldehyde dehydrogenase (NADP(+)) [Planctomycetales bacterium]